MEVLKVKHIIVCGHYGCGGVEAALKNIRIGLADNWIRHIQDVRDRHRDLLEAMPEPKRLNALVELNAIEQVVNVCQSTVLQDAWARGQPISVHGWVYGVHDGLLQDLKITVKGIDGLEVLYKAAIEGVYSSSRH